jgi:hypothetical protein
MGNKEDANNELYEGFEKWAAGRDVKTQLIGQRESHEDRRDEPGVLAENVAAGRHRDHGGELCAGAEHLVQPELAQQQPEHRSADDAAGHADPDAQRKLSHLAAQALCVPAVTP